MAITDMPDAITNPTTPVDQNGDAIQSDQWYRVTLGRRKAVLMLVREVPEESELYCRPKDSERWQPVHQMDPNCRWVKTDEDGNE